MCVRKLYVSLCSKHEPVCLDVIMYVGVSFSALKASLLLVLCRGRAGGGGVPGLMFFSVFGLG